MNAAAVRKPEPLDDDAPIELPPMDGGADDEGTPDPEDFAGNDVLSGEGDLDDSTGESDPIEDLAGEDSVNAGSIAADAEESATLDVGGIDPIGQEGESLLDGAEEPGTADDSLDIDEVEEGTRDAGEEGPAAEGDEVGLEDLPPMDADEEGAADDTAFFDELADEIPAPWADAAWEKFAEYPDVIAQVELAALGVEYDASGASQEPLGPGLTSVKASALVDGELICARTKATIDASCVFLFSKELGARTIAEVGNSEAYDVSFLVWDAPRGVLWIGGDFGLVGYRPPAKRTV